MATYIPKLMDINKQYQMAYFDEMRRREEMERQDMMRRAAARRMMDMQRQPTMGDRGVGNFGLSEGGVMPSGVEAAMNMPRTMGGTDPSMTWKALDAVSKRTGIDPNNLYKGVLQSGQLMAQGGAQPMSTTQEYGNAQANAPLPKGADAQLSQQYTQAEDTASRAQELAETTGKYKVASSAAHGTGYPPKAQKPITLTQEEKLIAYKKAVGDSGEPTDYGYAEILKNNINKYQLEALEARKASMSKPSQTQPSTKKDDWAGVPYKGNVTKESVSKNMDMVVYKNEKGGVAMTQRGLLKERLMAKRPDLSGADIDRLIDKAISEDPQRVQEILNSLNPNE